MSTWLSLRAPTHAPPPLQGGWTALSWAVVRGLSTIVKVLLAAGADVKALNTVGLDVEREG